MQRPTIYLRRVIDPDPALLSLLRAAGSKHTPASLFPKVHAVAYYRSPSDTEPVCINHWSSKPTRRNKWVMLNCSRYRAVWLADAK